jgi:glycosyltransferase involved in cell wall biosynthesis
LASISVIIPTYNRSWSLKRCIDSVLNQSLPPDDIIIVDDGSNDSTPKLLNSYNDKIKVITTSQQGVSAARNIGVQNSNSEWIAFLDSDDEWHPDKLKNQWTFHQENPYFKCSQTKEIWIRDGVRVNPPKHLIKKSGFIFEKSLKNCMITPSSFLIQKDLFWELQGFDENFKTCEDYDLWLRLTAFNEVPLIDEDLLIRYGGHEDQLSAHYPVMDIYRIQALLKILKHPKLPFELKEKTSAVVAKKIKIVSTGAEKRGNMEVLAQISRFSAEFEDIR